MGHLVDGTWGAQPISSPPQQTVNSCVLCRNSATRPRPMPQQTIRERMAIPQRAEAIISMCPAPVPERIARWFSAHSKILRVTCPFRQRIWPVTRLKEAGKSTTDQLLSLAADTGHGHLITPSLHNARPSLPDPQEVSPIAEMHRRSS